MKRFIAITAAFGLALTSSSAFAQATLNTDVKAKTGASANAPGIQMKQKSSVNGTTGASGYAPGHKMQARSSVKGTTGASGYAPGHIKSNTNVSGDVKVRAR